MTSSAESSQIEMQQSSGNETPFQLLDETKEPNDNDHDHELYSCSNFVRNVPGALRGGLGLFGESYLLFSIGTMKPLWEILYPDCLNTHVECSEKLTSSMAYGVILGVIGGMILLGTLANTLGRRVGSITTASFMAGGSIGLALLPVLFSQNAALLFQCMTATLFVFGIGVGGEYPLSAASASEKAMQELQERRNECSNSIHAQTEMNTNNSIPKGRAVLLTFSMQGMGVFVNSLIQSILLFLMGEMGNYAGDDGVYDANVEYGYYDDGAIRMYNPSNLLTIWRLVYLFGAVTLVYVLAWRYRHLNESDIWLASQSQTTHPKSEDSDQQSSHQLPDHEKSNSNQQHSNTYLLTKVLEHYGSRLFGCSMCWLLWDIAFYGNKLFQSTFLRAIAGDNATLLHLSLAATLNAFVALCGYYAAAYIVDLPKVGRFRLQLVGFLLTGILFLACGVHASGNDNDNISPILTIALYLGSSFFGQCGPNATTFLVPAEIFPTSVRTMCHGMSASAGKVGALISAVLFSFIKSDQQLFLISAYTSLAAALLTFITIPETTQLDLRELDIHWQQCVIGDGGLRQSEKEYNGVATKPEYMSLWEKKMLERKLRSSHGNGDHASAQLL
jgi:MFS family permease